MMIGYIIAGLLLQVSLFVEINAIIQTYTVTGVPCMTDCFPYNDYHYCYLGWGHSYWDYCTPHHRGKVGLNEVYYTSLYNGIEELCTSHCGTWLYSYNWCYIDKYRNWDYCSDTPGYSSYRRMRCIGSCERSGRGNSYSCLVEKIYSSNGVKEVYDICAPDPVKRRNFED